MVIIIILLLIALFAQIITPYNPTTIDLMHANQTPNWSHLFGTDELGRDILSRCLAGTQVSLPMGIAGAISSVILGGILGLIAAFFMGRIDHLIMRVMDVLQAIPGILMAIAVVATIGIGIFQLLLAMAISSLPMFARAVRAAVLTVRDSEYVEASRTIGARTVRLMLRHIMPNCVGHLIIFAVGSISGSILIISTLSFLGLGVAPPTPEWGAMLSAGKTYIQSYPHMVIFPGLMIMITVFAFNLFGDGVRDALDPKMR